MADFSTMPAGPELDRLIAERVMGIRAVYHKRSDSWCVDRPSHDSGGWDDEATAMRIFFEPGVYQGNFHPSTNIAHAFEVLAALAKHEGRWLSMMWDQGGCWSIELEAGCDGFKDVGRTVGDTLPIAICRAALLAVTKK